MEYHRPAECHPVGHRPAARPTADHRPAARRKWTVHHRFADHRSVDRRPADRLTAGHRTAVRCSVARLPAGRRRPADRRTAGSRTRDCHRIAARGARRHSSPHLVPAGGTASRCCSTRRAARSTGCHCWPSRPAADSIGCCCCRTSHPAPAPGTGFRGASPGCRSGSNPTIRRCWGCRPMSWAKTAKMAKNSARSWARTGLRRPASSSRSGSPSCSRPALRRRPTTRASKTSASYSCCRPRAIHCGSRLPGQFGHAPSLEPAIGSRVQC